jgi:hypothetical protein
MRTFSIISILLALAVAAILWQKLLVNTAPDQLPDPAEYSTMTDNQTRSLTVSLNLFRLSRPRWSSNANGGMM